MRRDQAPASSNFKGSGLPMPSKGDFKVASIKSRILSALRLSLSVQWRVGHRPSAFFKVVTDLKDLQTFLGRLSAANRCLALAGERSR